MHADLPAQKKRSRPLVAMSAQTRRRPQRAYIPRHRKNTDHTTLTVAVRRILMRANANPRPFGVFVIDGRLFISDTHTERFAAMQRRWEDQLIGIYTRQITVTDLLSDLHEYFLDKDASPETGGVCDT